MKLRRGFVKEAEEYALEYRQEIGLAGHDPLCPLRLAEHLAIPVHRLSSFPGIPDETRLYFFTKGIDEFSATVLKNGSSSEILHNDRHHPNRQNSNIMHEIAHVILGHRQTAPLTGDGERNFNKIEEREANELGFTLLVPKPAALFALESFASRSDAAAYLGVSKSLLDYRIRKTNASGWARNRALKRRA